MDKVINRIRINKLSSENNVFDAIKFHTGINLILGEKYDNKTTQGRKTNGVGKSMAIELLNFCFLSDYEKSRIYKIPENVLPLEENIILDITIENDDIQIKRNRKYAGTPVIIKSGDEIIFNKLNDAKEYLTELIFNELSTNEVPSFRNLLSLLIRDERSEFMDILKCHDVSKRIPTDFTPHLFLLGISLSEYKSILSIVKETDGIKEILKKTKNELTQNGSKGIADVKAELNELNSELEQLEKAIDLFKTNETFESVEPEIIELENMLMQLRQRQKVLKHEYERIKSLPQPELIDDAEIEMIYNHFKENLGTAVVKSLNEVVGFKNKVEDFQRLIMNQKARELEKNISEISAQIRELDDQYSKTLQIVDKKGVLKNLKMSLSIYEKKKESSIHTKFLFEQFEKYGKQKNHLDLQKKQELIKIDSEIESLKSELDSFTKTILDIHESIMGNRECSFEINAKQNGNTKDPIDINLRIFDDGSHSVNRTKVFIYDMALMFNTYTRQKHPLFLVHDNIFDVDQDTLVQCLNFLHQQDEYFSDFQYILTLNRDKIENEERRNQIKIDIEKQTVASFTKENKLFKKNYQEKI